MGIKMHEGNLGRGGASLAGGVENVPAGRAAEAMGSTQDTVGWRRYRGPEPQSEGLLGMESEGDQGKPRRVRTLFERRLDAAVERAGGEKHARGALGTLLYHLNDNSFMEMPTRTIGRITTEALGAGSFDSLLVDAQHKRLQKGYELRAVKWPMLVPSPRNISDFKTQYAIQVGSLGLLPSVAKGAPYPNRQFTDDSASYTVAKYGCMYGASFEAMTNDDLGQLGKIAQMMGSAAAHTVDDFVFGTLIDDNPTAYDGTALFHSSHSNNLGASTPLSATNLEAACKLLQAQTDLDGQPLDIVPRYLIVHPDEQYEAMRLVKSEKKPGTAQNEINVFQGALEVIVTARVTSGRWYVAADPALFDWIEVGFLRGQQAPEFWEEAINAGRWYDFDEKRYKVRTVFGGIVCDYRGIVRGNVA